MAVFLLKLAADCFWYLAIIGPYAARAPWAVKLVLAFAPCAYAALFAARFFRDRSSASFQDVFLLQAKVLAAALFVQLITTKHADWNRYGIPFAVLYLIFGLLLLRLARLPEPVRREGRCWRLNAGYLAAAAAAAALLASQTARNAAVAGLGAVYRLLILPILLAVLQVLVWVVAALGPLFAPLFRHLPEGLNQGQIILNVDPEQEIRQISRTETPALLKAAAAAIGILILLAVFRYLYRRAFSGGERRGGAPNAVSRRSFGPEGDPGSEPPRLLQKKDARYYYRKFLRLCEERGMKLGKGDTSESVRLGAGRIFSGADGLRELRDLYRSVRYDAGETDREREKERGRRARKLYLSLKNEGESRP